MNGPCHQDAIRRMCLLQAKVAPRLFDSPSDCFCGEGGFWESAEYDGSHEGGYRNDFEAIEFIEKAVIAALKGADR
ncbi:hypothetical protein LCGC14_1808410 [marine sediment metagenome]|uniref:Uncharacterized protein n=1 Tax=marine sediment metagenome TaxID=412755 RepID=A0A0F9GMB5_9ZZZZ